MREKHRKQSEDHKKWKSRLDINYQQILTNMSSSNVTMNTNTCKPKRSSLRKSGSPKSIDRRSVGFGRLDIIEFPQILGDNPACHTGAPLTLDWKPMERSTMPVDFYEFTRDPRRSKKELLNDKDERLQHLLNSGYQMDEIAMAVIVIEQVKRERADTVKKSNRSIFRAMEKTLKTVAKQPTKLYDAAMDMSASATASMRARSA